MIVDLQPFAVSGRLFGDDMGVVAVRGVDGDRVSALVTAAQQADATATGTLWLEDKWALADDDSVKALQDALGTTTKNKATLRAEGFQQLAQRLASPDSRVEGEEDLLVVLQDAGFLGYDAVGDATIARVPRTRCGRRARGGQRRIGRTRARRRAGGEGAARGRGAAGGRQRVGPR